MFIYEENKIYMQDEKGEEIAYVTFPEIENGVVSIEHTYVSRKLRGQGIADKLLHAAYAHIKEKGLKANLVCSYAVKWMEVHEDKRDILK